MNNRDVRISRLAYRVAALYIAVLQPGRGKKDAAEAYTVWSGDVVRYGGAEKKRHPVKGSPSLPRDWWITPGRMKRIKSPKNKARARAVNAKVLPEIQERYKQWKKLHWRKRAQRVETMERVLAHYEEEGPRKGLQRGDVKIVKKLLKKQKQAIKQKAWEAKRLVERKQEREEWAIRRQEIEEEKRQLQEEFKHELAEREEPSTPEEAFTPSEMVLGAEQAWNDVEVSERRKGKEGLLRTRGILRHLKNTSEERGISQPPENGAVQVNGVGDVHIEYLGDGTPGGLVVTNLMTGAQIEITTLVPLMGPAGILFNTFSQAKDWQEVQQVVSLLVKKDTTSVFKIERAEADLEDLQAETDDERLKQKNEIEKGLAKVMDPGVFEKIRERKTFTVEALVEGYIMPLLQGLPLMTGEVGGKKPLKGTPFNYRMPEKHELLVTRPGTSVRYRISTNKRLDFNRLALSVLKYHGEKVFEQVVGIAALTWKNSIRPTLSNDPSVDPWTPTEAPF